MDKKQARETGLFYRSSLSQDQRRIYQAQINKELKAFLKAFDAVGIFVSIKDEVDTKAIIDWLFKQKKRVAVPRVIKNTLDFYWIESFDDLEPSIFSLLEPKTSCPKVDLKDLPLMLVPLASFDACGHRCGYGKGYYDSILKPSMLKIGLCFKGQQVDFIEVEDHDVTLDGILTELGLEYFK